jgi:zinc-ribbon domain
MVCASCGTALAADAHFCSACGAAVAEPPPKAVVPAPAPSEALEPHGGVRGWLDRRKAEHDERRREDERYEAALVKIRAGDDSAQTLAELRTLADPRHRGAGRAALKAFSDRLLADDVLSAAEESRWQAVGDALGVTQADLALPELEGLLVHLMIARINDGRLPEVAADQARLMVKRGETVHLETPAALMKEVVDREFRGGSRGVSIPIAKGVRYRTGSFRGKSVVVGSHMETADTGIVSVSSKRVVFLGSRKTVDTPYAKLAGLDAFSDGIRIHASNRQTAPLYRIPIGGEVVAAAIQAAAQREA